MRTPELFRAQLKEALLVHADGLASQQVRQPPVRRSRRAITRLLPSAAAVVTAAAVSAVILTSEGTAPPAASAATALYASAAALQRSGPSLELGPHGYLYLRMVSRSRFIDPGGDIFLHELAETWTSRDGAGRTEDIVLNRSVVKRRLDMRLGPSIGRLDPSAHPFTMAEPTSLSYAQLQRLPSSPTRLARAVSQLANQTARALKEPYSRSGHSNLVLYILRSIAVSPAPIPVRAAVYEVMASTPGIKLLGLGHDAIGRPGDMFAATFGPMRAEIIINPTTGRLLQFSRILMHRSGGAFQTWQPGLISQDTYVREAVVGSATARPR
jgi:hypothetical protein